MEANFPENLSIHASDPSPVLHYLAHKDLSSLEEQGFSVSDGEAIVSSQSSDIETYGIAGRIWEAAYAMVLYLSPPISWDFDPRSSISDGNGAVVELGAGNGFLGFQIAQTLSLRPGEHDIQPKTLVLTDLEAVCPLLERNRLREMHRPAHLSSVNLLVQPLEWGNLEHGYQLADLLATQLSSVESDRPVLLSHILCSDLVYFPELLAPLLRSLLQLSSPPFSTAAHPVKLIISYMIRSLPKEMPFWGAFGTWFDFSPVLFRQKPSQHWKRFGDQEENTLFVFVATRKPESLLWEVPDNPELMRRGTDAFETFLFMNMCKEE